jgi:thymidylate synthase (FAD)
VGFAFSQLSQQYHDESDAQFVEPPQLHNSPTARAAWQQATEVARQAYHQILESISAEWPPPTAGEKRREITRAIRSTARSVLPNATETKIVLTANARALRHFLKVRGTIPGDLEMRLVSVELLGLLSKQAPSLFVDFQVEQWEDGFPIVKYEACEGLRS